jgi:hypothetical protein
VNWPKATVASRRALGPGIDFDEFVAQVHALPAPKASAPAAG